VVLARGPIQHDVGTDMVSVHAFNRGGSKAQAHPPEGIVRVRLAFYLERIEPKLTLIQIVLGINGIGDEIDEARDLVLEGLCVRVSSASTPYATSVSDTAP
jgi:hypothetical protein